MRDPDFRGCTIHKQSLCLGRLNLSKVSFIQSECSKSRAVSISMYISIHSSTRMLLWDKDDRTYGYYIEVSTDQKIWTRVVDRSNDSCQ